MSLVWDVLDTDEMKAALQLPASDGADEDVQLRAELRDIDRLKDRNYDAFQDGIVDKQRDLRRERELDERRDVVQERLVRVMSQVVMSAVPSLDAARERWARGDVPWRRAFLSYLIKEVRVARHPQCVASILTRFSSAEKATRSSRSESNNTAPGSCESGSRSSGAPSVVVLVHEGCGAPAQHAPHDPVAERSRATQRVAVRRPRPAPRAPAAGTKHSRSTRCLMWPTEPFRRGTVGASSHIVRAPQWNRHLPWSAFPGDVETRDVAKPRNPSLGNHIRVIYHSHERAGSRLSGAREIQPPFFLAFSSIRHEPEGKCDDRRG